MIEVRHGFGPIDEATERIGYPHRLQGVLRRLGVGIRIFNEENFFHNFSRATTVTCFIGRPVKRAESVRENTRLTVGLDPKGAEEWAGFRRGAKARPILLEIG